MIVVVVDNGFLDQVVDNEVEGDCCILEQGCRKMPENFLMCNKNCSPFFSLYFLVYEILVKNLLKNLPWIVHSSRISPLEYLNIESTIHDNPLYSEIQQHAFRSMK